MNKILRIMAIPALALGLTSCEDWLDLPSESKMDSQSAFESISRAEMSVMGCYNWLHTQELGYQLLEGTDESVSTESNSKYNVSNYDYTNTSGMLSGTYTNMYKAIEYANVCIDALPQMSISDSESAKRDMLLGEALAIRAYAYWNLVRFYGDVPFVTVPTSTLTTFASSRTSRDVIWDQCVSDLQRAIELLPWQSEAGVTPERFTRNSAYGILARVALYAAGYSLRWDLSTTPYDPASVRIARRDDASRVNELYQIAANACQAVIERKENSLVANYEQLFRDLALEQYNNETMLEFGMHGTNAPDVRTGYVNGIPASGTSPNVGKIAPQMMAMPTFYFEFDEGDQRRDVSICNYGIVGNSSGDKYQMETYAGMGVGKYRCNWKKERGSSDSKRDFNWPLLRYSDVLLMYAEALNELNNGANASAINAVREVRLRAFRNDADKVGEIPTSHDEFLDYIIQERKLELSNEGLRKSDLARWGILYEHLTAEKAKLIQLCNHEGRYAAVPQYRVYKFDRIPELEDPTVALPYQDATEADITKLGLSATDLTTLHTLNSGSKGLVSANVLEGSDGRIYFSPADVPADVTTTTVAYNILNMWSINSLKQKGNLSVKEVKEGDTTIATDNAWISGATGIYYGLKKNMVEILPFNTTAIIDVNPGLADQQHPCY